MSELWAEAFASAIGRINEELDTGRINKAFQKARHTLKKWPSPAQIIELMPRRPEMNQLSYDPPADSKTAKKYFEICHQVVNGSITMETANALFSEIVIIEEEIQF